MTYLRKRTENGVSKLLSKEALACLALALAALFWSGNFVAGRALRDSVDPIVLNTLRWTICLGIFLPFVGARLYRKREVVFREWRLVLALGATGIAAFHTMVYFALTDTAVINALLILALAPVVILFGAALVRRNRPTPLQYTGSLVSLLGAGVLIARADPTIHLHLKFNHGDGWMFGSVVVWAAYSLLLRGRPSDLPQDVTLAASIIAALLILIPLNMAAGAPFQFIHSPAIWAAILYIAVVASLIAFLLWSYGVAEIGPERAGQFIHLMPIFGAGLAMVLLGEPVVLSQVVGATLVLAGILLVNRRRGRPPGH